MATSPPPWDNFQTILAKPKTQKKERCVIFVPVEKKKEGKRKALEISYDNKGVESAEFMSENELLVVGNEKVDWMWLVEELREKFGPDVRQRKLVTDVDAGGHRCIIKS